jgi:outer membrane protein W
MTDYKRKYYVKIEIENIGDLKSAQHLENEIVYFVKNNFGIELPRSAKIKHNSGSTVEKINIK